jgi:predicted nucleotidyltransferase
MHDSNREPLIAAARALRPLLKELVFVGGSVTGVLITDEGAGDPRGTLDVDAIAAIHSYAAYAAFGERLRAHGFNEDTNEEAPTCRWINQQIVLDVMPLEAKILGFSNRWYGPAMEAALTKILSDDIEVRIVTAPFFVATKVEAFKGRGKGDFFSRDLEDLVTVVNGVKASLRRFDRNPRNFRVTFAPRSNGYYPREGFSTRCPDFFYPMQPTRRESISCLTG